MTKTQQVYNRRISRPRSARGLIFVILLIEAATVLSGSARSQTLKVLHAFTGGADVPILGQA